MMDGRTDGRGDSVTDGMMAVACYLRPVLTRTQPFDFIARFAFTELTKR